MANEVTSQKAVTAVKPVNALKNMLDAPSVKSQFESVLKDNAPMFVASLIDMFAADSKIQQCEPKALINEALKAAILKLPITKSLGFSYIVPFNKKEHIDGKWVTKAVPTFIIGYKGYIQLAIRSGQYKYINADEVLEGEYRGKDKLTGEIDLKGEAISDRVVGYFAHIELHNGFRKTLYSTTDQINDYAKRYSKSYDTDKSIWKSDFSAMAKKTQLRVVLSHYGLLSPELINAMNSDADFETTEQKVDSEIKGNANSKNVNAFQDAEVVSSTVTVNNPFADEQ